LLPNNPTVTYTARYDTKPEAELGVLAAINSFVSQKHREKQRSGPALAAPTTPKGDLVTAPPLMYLNDPESLLVVFDLSIPGGADALDQHRAALRGNCDTEILDEHHRALIIRPGGVSGRAA
jgi:hypothetical protein